MARTKQTARKNLGGKSPRRSPASRQSARFSNIQFSNVQETSSSEEEENQIYVKYKGKEIPIQQYIDILTNNNSQNDDDSNDYIKNNAEDLMESLVIAEEVDDYELYKKLVENNKTLVDKLDGHFWPELFSGGSKKEIEFWVNYSEKSQRILDLSLIPIFYEHLFDIGLNQPNIDMDEIGDAIDDLIEKAKSETNFEGGQQKKYMARIKKIKKRDDELNSKKSVVHGK